jgi:hypothetical protein
MINLNVDIKKLEVYSEFINYILYLIILIKYFIFVIL